MAQEEPVVDYEEVESSIPDSLKTHSVRKATLLSAAFPGLGQIYNKKVWKLPIVYGAIGTCVYFAIDNHQTYRSYLDDFYLSIDTLASPNGIVNGYDSRQLIQLQNIYRRWRDLAIIVGAGIYLLNIVDAHVDAHLFYYDVSDDIDLKFEPSLVAIRRSPYPAIGFSLTLDFK